jgi:hypothetical protein
MQWHGVGLPADMAGHHRHCTEFAHGSGVTQNHAIQQTPFDIGQCHAPKNLPSTGAKHHGRLFFFITLRLHKWNQFTGNKWKRDENRRQHHARYSKNNFYIVGL